MSSWAHRQLHCTTEDCTWQVYVVQPFPDDHSYARLLLRAHGDDELHGPVGRVTGLLVDIESGEIVVELRV